MGFFSGIIDNVTPTFTNALSSAARNAQNALLYGEVGDTGQVKLSDIKVSGKNEYNSNNFSVFASSRENSDNKVGQYHSSHPTFLKTSVVSTSESVTNQPESHAAIPNWGYKDFINERVSWQKSLDSLTGEPGWFYFKIFFKFDTNFGLFPGILTDGNYVWNSQNSAMNYLTLCEANYKTVRSAHRKAALSKFVKTLSWINCNAPWFFKKVSGMDSAGYTDLNDITKEKFIEIECSEDAVDMRLTSLFEYYRYACFDYMNHREVIPENLRKFDMSIVVFHTPLRYYHTSGQSLTQGSFPYKSLHADAYGDRMSFHMVTFSNCEFVVDSLNGIPSELNNEKAFNIGQNKIKIKYNKAYVTNLNEWFRIMISDIGGIIWDDAGDLDAEQAADKLKQNTKNRTKEALAFGKEKNADMLSQYAEENGFDSEEDALASIQNDAILSQLAYDSAKKKAKEAKQNREKLLGKQQKRLEAIKYAIDHRFMYNPDSLQYKSLIDASEDVIMNAMRMIKPEDSFGNMYGGYTDPAGDYYKQKLEYENGHDTELQNKFKAMHNQDMADANNPMSKAYQPKLHDFKKTKHDTTHKTPTADKWGNTNKKKQTWKDEYTKKDTPNSGSKDKMTNSKSDWYKENLHNLQKQTWNGNKGDTNPMLPEYQDKIHDLKKQTWNGHNSDTNPMSPEYQTKVHDLKKTQWNGNNGPTEPMSSEYQQTVADLRKTQWNGNEGPTNPMSEEYQQTVHDLKKQTWTANEGPTESSSEEYQQTVHDLKKTQWNGNNGPTNPMSEEYQEKLRHLKKNKWQGNNGPTNPMSDEYQQTLYDLKKTQWYGNEGPTEPMSDEYQSTIHDLKKTQWHGNDGHTEPFSDEYQQTLHDLKKTQWYGNKGPTNPMSSEYQQTVHDLKKTQWYGNDGHTEPFSDEYQQTLHDLKKQTWYGNKGPTESSSSEYQQTIHDLKKTQWYGNEGHTEPFSDEYQQTLHDLKKTQWTENAGPTNPMSGEYQQTVHDLKKTQWYGNNGPTEPMSAEYQSTIHDLKKQTWYGNKGPTESSSSEYQSTIHDLKKTQWNGNNGPTNPMSGEYQTTIHDLKKQTWYGNKGPTESSSSEYQQTIHDLKKTQWNGNNGLTEPMSSEYQSTIHDLKKTQWNGNNGPTEPMSSEYQQTIHNLKK